MSFLFLNAFSLVFLSETRGKIQNCIQQGISQLLFWTRYYLLLHFFRRIMRQFTCNHVLTLCGDAKRDISLKKCSLKICFKSKYIACFNVVRTVSLQPFFFEIFQQIDAKNQSHEKLLLPFYAYFTMFFQILGHSQNENSGDENFRMVYTMSENSNDF